jgi:hypothetical protein
MMDYQCAQLGKYTIAIIVQKHRGHGTVNLSLLWYTATACMRSYPGQAAPLDIEVGAD